MEFDVWGFLFLLFGVSLEIFGFQGLEFTVPPVCAGLCGSYLPLGVPIAFACQFFLVGGNWVQDENYPGCFSNPTVRETHHKGSPIRMFGCSVFGRIHLPLSCLLCGLYLLSGIVVDAVYRYTEKLDFSPFVLMPILCEHRVHWFLLRTCLFEVERQSLYLCLFSRLLFFWVHLAHIPLPCWVKTTLQVSQVRWRVLLIPSVLKKKFVSLAVLCIRSGV